MPSDKNQHYVPKFYLRNFSSDGYKSIGLINLRSGKIVETANIKNQCSKDYFYTPDGRNEKPFSEVEGLISRTIKELLNTEKLPDEGSSEIGNLYTFISFQRSRTSGALSQYLEFLTKFGREFLRSHFAARGETELAKFVDCVVAEDQGAAIQLVKESLISAPILFDLNLSLLKVRGREKFITSDDPIILTNHFHFGPKGEPSVGISSRGLIVICPLSPIYYIILFDKEVYKVNSGLCSKGEPIEVNDQDVININTFQYKNAQQNLYFRSIGEINKSLASFPPRRGNSIRLAGKIDTAWVSKNNGGEMLQILTRQIAPRWPHNLNVLSIRKNAKRMQFVNGNKDIRDLRMTEFIRHLQRDDNYQKYVKSVGL